VAHEVLRGIRRALSEAASPRILINLEAEIADYLYEAEAEQIEAIERQFDTHIIPVAREGYHREKWRIVRSQATLSVEGSADGGADQ
jgi:hypothetical protein